MPACSVRHSEMSTRNASRAKRRDLRVKPRVTGEACINLIELRPNSGRGRYGLVALEGVKTRATFLKIRIGRCRSKVCADWAVKLAAPAIWSRASLSWLSDNPRAMRSDRDRRDKLGDGRPAATSCPVIRAVRAYWRYCWIRVVRSPARPWRSIEYCQARNSSTVSV
jgi:hypothetical protein